MLKEKGKSIYIIKVHIFCYIVHSIRKSTLKITLVQLQMHDKTLEKLHYFVFKNKSIYMRCHKSFCVNLGEGTLFFMEIISFLLFWW